MIGIPEYISMRDISPIHSDSYYRKHNRRISAEHIACHVCRKSRTTLSKCDEGYICKSCKNMMKEELQ